jgi:hypothetical protein
MVPTRPRDSIRREPTEPKSAPEQYQKIIAEELIKRNGDLGLYASASLHGGQGLSNFTQE